MPRTTTASVLRASVAATLRMNAQHLWAEDETGLIVANVLPFSVRERESQRLRNSAKSTARHRAIPTFGIMRAERMTLESMWVRDFPNGIAIGKSVDTDGPFAARHRANSMSVRMHRV